MFLAFSDHFISFLVLAVVPQRIESDKNAGRWLRWQRRVSPSACEGGADPCVLEILLEVLFEAEPLHSTALQIPHTYLYVPFD